MPQPFVPVDFEIPTSYVGAGFRLEPLGPEHNNRDYEAWMSSIAHIRETPGFEESEWPSPMTLEENLADLVGHAEDFSARRGFTYSVVDDEDVIGCLYIYPSKTASHDATVKSWIRETRSDMDIVIWRLVSQWLVESWPFSGPLYAERNWE